MTARSELPSGGTLLVPDVLAQPTEVTVFRGVRTPHVIDAVPTLSATVHHLNAVVTTRHRQAAAVPALPNPGAVADQIRAAVAVCISNGTAAHPDAGLLIGNGFDGPAAARYSVIHPRRTRRCVNQTR